MISCIYILEFVARTSTSRDTEIYIYAAQFSRGMIWLSGRTVDVRNVVKRDKKRNIELRIHQCIYRIGQKNNSYVILMDICPFTGALYSAFGVAFQCGLHMNSQQDTNGLDIVERTTPRRYVNLFHILRFIHWRFNIDSIQS